MKGESVVLRKPMTRCQPRLSSVSIDVREAVSSTGPDCMNIIEFRESQSDNIIKHLLYALNERNIL